GGAGPTALEQQLIHLEELILAFTRHEEEVLVRRGKTTEAQTRQTYPVIAGAIVLGLLFTWVSILTAARGVARPVARLREAAGLLMAGHDRSVTPEGPTEIAELMVLFNHMALTLSQRTRLLEQQQESYRTYIGAVAHILWTTDAQGLVVKEMPTWQDYTGQSGDAIRGLGWFDAVHPEDQNRVRAAWQKAVVSRGTYEQEFRLRSASGEYHPFSCKGVPIVNADGSVREWIGTCTDMSETRRRQELMQRLEVSEAASQAKTAFLTRMSHELRTPLNAVIGMSKMLQTLRFGPLTAKQADYVSDITRARGHLPALIKHNLDPGKVAR